MRTAITHVGEEIGKVGYFPANPQELDQAKRRWLVTMGLEHLLAQP